MMGANRNLKLFMRRMNENENKTLFIVILFALVFYSKPNASVSSSPSSIKHVNSKSFSTSTSYAQSISICRNISKATKGQKGSKRLFHACRLISNSLCA